MSGLRIEPFGFVSVDRAAGESPLDSSVGRVLAGTHSLLGGEPVLLGTQHTQTYGGDFCNPDNKYDFALLLQNGSMVP